MRGSVLVSVFGLIMVMSSVVVGQDCVEMTPGKSLGPIAIGMSRADLERSGLALQPGPIMTWFEIGPYTVRMENDQVATIGLDGAHGLCVRVAGQDVSLEESLEDLTQAIPGQCGPAQFNIGATVVDCAAGVMLLQHRAGIDLRVLAATPVVEDEEG